MTEKNILQNWFVTGAKPTQEQFWAWQESYWHKSESIPTEKILGLSEVLANKADAEMLQHKANLDSSNLTDEHVLAWKEKLGVGELPTNIATIDEGTKQGSVYTKTKVDELLENSGKNIANTDLQIPAGVVRTLNVEGAKFGIQGLENKANDNSFNLQLITNSRGDFGVAPYVKYQFIASAITINQIAPNNIQPRPTFAEDVERILRDFKTYQMEELTDFTTEGNLKRSNIVFNSSKDFVISITNIAMVKKSEIAGIGRESNMEYGVYSKSENYGYGFSWKLGDNTNIFSTGDNRGMAGLEIPTLLIIKTGGVITIGALFKGIMTYKSFNANAELGDYRVIISSHINPKVKYKILN